MGFVMKRWLGRVLVVVGAVLLVYAVSSTTWWTFHDSSRMFDDMTGAFGPYVGKWCSAPFCHDLDFKLHGLGSLYGTLGAAVFYAALVAAAAAIMTLLAGAQGAVFKRVTAVTSTLAIALAGALVTTRGELREASVSFGPGILLLVAGAVAASLGAYLVEPLRVPDLPSPVGRVLLVGAAVLVLGATVSKAWWHWSWSDERNSIGLTTTERCWEYRDGSRLCSTAAGVDEMFMTHTPDEPSSRFADAAHHTYDAGIAAAIFAVLVAILRPRRWLSQAHVVWIVLLESAFATIVMTPDEGTARDPHVGIAFYLVVLACIAGLAGHTLLARELGE